MEQLEPRWHFDIAGAASGSVLYQYNLADGTAMRVPLAGWTVYDDVNNTGSYAAGDPVAVTGLDGSFSLALAGNNQAVRLMPRSGWVTAAGTAAAVSASPGQTISPFCQSMADPTVIDVLAAYTASASEVAGVGGNSITQDLNSLFAYANQVQANSDTNIIINLVDVMETNYSESPSFEADLSALAANRIADVSAARQAESADVAVLFEGSADRSSGGEVGIAYEFNRHHPTPSQGDAIVGLLGNSARDGVTLAHELGHVLGADHDPAHVDDGLSASFARGYEFVGDNGVSYQDVMSYGSGTFLPYYSTPAAFYAGHVMGLLANGDNARAVRADGSMVARYAISGDEGPTTAPTESTLIDSVSIGKPGRAILGSSRTSAVVTLTNVGPDADASSATLTLVLDGNAGATNDPILASSTVNVRLRLGQSQRVVLPLVWPVGLASGNCAIETTIISGGALLVASDDQAPAANNIAYLQPTVDLSLSSSAAKLKADPGRTLSIPLLVSDLGNSPASGMIGFAVTLTPTSGEATSFSPPARRALVPASARRSLACTIKLPPNLASGSYVLSIQINDATAPADTDLLDKAVTLNLILL